MHASSLTFKSQCNDELVQALANCGLLVYNELNEFVLRFWRVLLELQADLWGWGWGDSGVGVEAGVGDSAVGVGGQCSGGLRVGELLTVVPLRSLGASPPQAPSSTLGPRPLWQGCGLRAEEDPTPGTRHQSVDDHHLRKTSYDVTRCHVVHHVTSYEIMWFIMQCNIWYVISGDTVHCVLSCDSDVMSCTTTCDVMHYNM